MADALDQYLSGLDDEDRTRLSRVLDNAQQVADGKLGSIYHGSDSVERDSYLLDGFRAAAKQYKMEAVQGPTDTASFGAFGEAGEMARFTPAGAVIGGGFDALGTAFQKAGVPPNIAHGIMMGLGLAGLGFGLAQGVRAAAGGVGEEMAAATSEGLGAGAREVIGPQAGASPAAVSLPGGGIGNVLRTGTRAGEAGLVVRPRGEAAYERTPEMIQAQGSRAPEGGAFAREPEVVPATGSLQREYPYAYGEGETFSQSGAARFAQPPPENAQPGTLTDQGGPEIDLTSEGAPMVPTGAGRTSFADEGYETGDYVMRPTGEKGLAFDEPVPTGDYELTPSGREQFVPYTQLSEEDLRRAFTQPDSAFEPLQIADKAATPRDLEVLQGHAQRAQQFTGDRQGAYLAQRLAEQEPMVAHGGNVLRRAIARIGDGLAGVRDLIERPYTTPLVRSVTPMPFTEQARLNAIGSGAADLVQEANAANRYMREESLAMEDHLATFEALPADRQGAIWHALDNAPRQGAGTMPVLDHLPAEDAALTRALLTAYDDYGALREPALAKGLRDTYRVSTSRSIEEWERLANDPSNPAVQKFARGKLSEATDLKGERLTEAINNGTIRGMGKRFTSDYARDSQVDPEFLPPPQDKVGALRSMFREQIEAAAQGKYYGRRLNDAGGIEYSKTAPMRARLQEELRQQGASYQYQQQALKWFDDFHDLVTGQADRPYNPGLNILRSLNIISNATFGVAKHSTQFATTALINPLASMRSAVLAAPEDAAAFGEFYARAAARMTQRIAQEVHGVAADIGNLQGRELDKWSASMVRADKQLQELTSKIGVPGLRQVMATTSKAIARQSVSVAETYVDMYGDALAQGNARQAAFAKRGLGAMGFGKDEVQAIMERGQLTQAEARSAAIGMHQRIMTIRPGDLPKLARTNPLAHMAYMFSATPVKIAHEIGNAVISDMQAGNVGGLAKVALMAPIIGTVPALSGAALRSASRLATGTDDPMRPFKKLPIAGGSQYLGGVKLTPSGPFTPDAFALQALYNMGLVTGTHAMGMMMERAAGLLKGAGDGFEATQGIREAWGPQGNWWNALHESERNWQQTAREWGIHGPTQAVLHGLTREAAIIGSNTAMGAALRGSHHNPYAPREAGAADFDTAPSPEEIERRKARMGDLGAPAAEAPSRFSPRSERLQAMLADAVKRGDTSGAAALRRSIYQDAAQPQ